MMTRYELIIYWSKDDDCFVVEVPELPGCMADVKLMPAQSQTQKSS
jgi:predicted RNase H-like HicB family nuclease